MATIPSSSTPPPPSPPSPPSSSAFSASASSSSHYHHHQLPIPAPPRTPSPPTPIPEEHLAGLGLDLGADDGDGHGHGGSGIGSGSDAFAARALAQQQWARDFHALPARSPSPGMGLATVQKKQMPTQTGRSDVHVSGGGHAKREEEDDVFAATATATPGEHQHHPPPPPNRPPSRSRIVPGLTPFGAMASPMSSAAGSPVINEGLATFAGGSAAGALASSAGTMVSAGSSVPPSPGYRGPFNFQTQTIKDAPVTRSNIGQRRGHRYKHSSVSTQHQIFLEPPPRAPLALPPSLPVPTLREAWHSMSREQTGRAAWCICHAAVAGYVLYSADHSLALTALSHLIFFDAISATICVAVDVFGNFEVWRRSSIRHPFGLERAEVLAGFAMSVFLLFMGFDLLSHNLKHVLEGLGHDHPVHEAVHDHLKHDAGLRDPRLHHTHARVSPGSVDAAALLCIVATLVSALGLKNHARIGKAMRLAYMSWLPAVLSNPSHLLTLSCSGVMLILPLLSITFYLWLDRLLCGVIAVSMFALGVRLATAQGLMLLMSYKGRGSIGSSSNSSNIATEGHSTGVREVLADLATEPAVTRIDEARFWQVQYGLCIAGLKLRVAAGTDEGALKRLRERVLALVKSRLGGGYGRGGGGGGVKWEVTTQFTVDG